MNSWSTPRDLVGERRRRVGDIEEARSLRNANVEYRVIKLRPVGRNFKLGGGGTK